MITSQEYRARLKKLKPNVYMDGDIISREDPRLAGGINIMSQTYDLAYKPEFEEVLTATSHLNGRKINRFTHIHQSVDDLLKKQKMTRLCSQEVGGCIQRCMGTDALNALSVVTHEVDQQGDTEYYQRFLKYLQYIQDNDLAANCAQTDVKGDRMKRPHEQSDPDLYLRIVEKLPDGIVVTGAKAHNTCSAYIDEIIALPTRRLTAEEGPWAVAFALPADWEGVTLINAAYSPRPRRKLHAPYAELGVSHSITVFDKVFVPWERVFLCGEWEAAGRLGLLFALYHRHSYTGCKAALSEIVAGAAALVAEYNGIDRSQHVRHKIAELIAVVELIFAAGIAAAVNARRASSGTYIPDVTFCNVGRYVAGTNIYKEYETLAEIAGGLPATLPPEMDFYNPKTGPYLEKYIMRKDGISAEDQHRCFRLLQDMMSSAWGGHKLIDALHGGGSPVMERIGILNAYDLESVKRLAKRLAGIKT
ncbi:MAG TPA: aromatic ring hydroxylase [Dehalococcoidia bacterium]|nr:aromatic ring hydroxylase [Dehalococcoidia bacterium]